MNLVILDLLEALVVKEIEGLLDQLDQLVVLAPQVLQVDLGPPVHVDPLDPEEKQVLLEQREDLEVLDPEDQVDPVVDPVRQAVLVLLDLVDQVDLVEDQDQQDLKLENLDLLEEEDQQVPEVHLEP